MENEKQISTRLLSCLIAYIKTNYGDKALNTAIKNASLDKKTLYDTAAWLSVDECNTFLKECISISKYKNCIFRSGQLFPDKLFGESTSLFEIEEGNIVNTYIRIIQNSNLFDRTSQWKIIKTTNNSIKLKFIPQIDADLELIHDLINGQLSAVPLIFGKKKPAHVKKEGQNVVFFYWKEEFNVVPILTIVCISAITYGVWHFTHSYRYTVSTFITISILLIITKLFKDTRKQNQLLQSQIDISQKQLRESYSNLEKKYDALLDYKQHLEDKVAEQTKELREKTEQLIELQDFKKKMSSLMVHDLKNNVTVINGNANLIQRKTNRLLKTPELPSMVKNTVQEIKTKANQILREGNFMLEILANILEVTKQETKELEISKVLVPVSRLISIVTEMPTGLYAEKNITFEQDIRIKEPNKIYCLCDVNLMTRVFYNLFNNAFKYTPENGKILFRVEADEKNIYFRELNSGQLIPDHFRQKIFELFGMVDGVRSPYSKGMGLYFCRLMADAHDGSISYDVIDNMNAFTFTLPRHKESK